MTVERRVKFALDGIAEEACQRPEGDVDADVLRAALDDRIDTARALIAHRRIMPLIVAAKPGHQFLRKGIDPTVNFFAAELMSPRQGYLRHQAVPVYDAGSSV